MCQTASPDSAEHYKIGSFTKGKEALPIPAITAEGIDGIAVSDVCHHSVFEIVRLLMLGRLNSACHAATVSRPVPS